ncbi:MAG: GGDEF-domain containing protein [Massilia sp.]|nr:GGDEF-domain containing protein [Massilia sp.]
MNQVDRIIPPALRAVPRERQAARHLALLAGLTAASAPLLAMLYHLLGFDAAGMVVFTGATVMLVAPFTLNAGFSLASARNLFIAALYALKVWLALNLGGIGAPTVSWFILCPMIALLLGGARPGLAWTGIVVATLFGLFIAEHSGVTMQAFPVSDPALLDLASNIGLVVLASVIVVLASNSSAGIERRAR